MSNKKFGNNREAKVQAVLRHLKSTPYICAEEIARKETLASGELNAIYKIIQTSPELQLELKKSDNHDYFDTVKNHFGRKQYTAVFFVGLYCPARCHFCPSVKINGDGFRELFRYKSVTSNQQKLNCDDIARIFDDLDQMRREGYRVSIKISGGLEPFTDPKTVGQILELAGKFGIDSTIFTNGMLLKLDKNRNLALRCDNLRISLSSSDEESYCEFYFGNHRDNKKAALLPDLLNALKMLIAERDASGAKTGIGINTVAGEFNFHELEKLVGDSAALGVDYIEIKGDYFGRKNSRWFDKLDIALSDISKRVVDGKVGNARVILTGSLKRNNFFNNKPEGRCLAEDQAAHKLFINPFGECTPVHHWAYPAGWQQHEAGQFLGSISQHASLFHLIKRAELLPELDYIHLNPFELILSLESARQRRDRAFGIDAECNPYLCAESDNPGCHQTTENESGGM